MYLLNKKMTATEVTIVVKGTNNYFLEALLEEVQKNLKENGKMRMSFSLMKWLMKWKRPFRH